ncbi:Phage tail tape measure protein [uncultured Caudovirales phage]|uniref:Phage tail tape measure protein n=1 Tax=uncultured Caudovirales phage TaxID=2100421 RepID=A0A6J5MW34_9CAUD|nr:Phage tail tape measure protein [uncultured Caudovirales phage]
MANRDTKLSIIVDAEDKTKAAFGTISNTLKTTSNRFDNLTGKMKSVGTVGAVGFAAATAAVLTFVKAGASFEQTTVAFTTMLGSADKAKELLKELSEFAASTPFQLPELENASKSLLAFGFSQKQIIPTMRQLGDVASLLNIPLGDLSEIYGKARVSGRLFAEDVNQLTGRGIPVIAEFAKQFGVTEDKVKGLVEAGVIGFSNLETAIASMTSEGGQFFGGMKAQSETLAGLWSTLSDELGAVARTIGEQLVPILKPFVEKLIEVARVIGEWVEKHPKLAAGIVIAITLLLALTALLFPLAIILSTVGTAFVTLGAIMGVTAGVAALASLGIIAAVAGVILIIVQVSRIITAFRDHWDEIWLGVLVYFTETMNKVIGYMESFVNFFIKAINLVIDGINKLISAMSRVPGLGAFKGFSISQLQTVQLERLDTNAIVSAQMAKDSQVRAGNTVVIQGNTLLDSNAAEIIGDKIMGQLKLSSSI